MNLYALWYESNLQQTQPLSLHNVHQINTKYERSKKREREVAGRLNEK